MLVSLSLECSNHSYISCLSLGLYTHDSDRVTDAAGPALAPPEDLGVTLHPAGYTRVKFTTAQEGHQTVAGHRTGDEDAAQTARAAGETSHQTVTTRNSSRT